MHLRPRHLFGRSRCFVGAVCALALLLGACSSQPGAPTEPPSPPPATVSSGPSPGRPIGVVPDVRPDGFVAAPPGSGLARYRQQPVSWQPCQRTLQCAKVLVPLDYDQPDGTAITLTLSKKVSTGRRLGTLFINPGGPGGSGVDFVGFFRSEGLEGYDIVGWDPRGVGQSTPVSCRGVDLDRYVALDNSPDDDAERTSLLEADRDFGQRCLQSSGPLLQHVSTVEVARDLDVLRNLVGEDKVNFFGASYGTQIGATYAELFAPRVGKMVLDGAVNISEDQSIDQQLGFDRAFGAFAEWCAARSCDLGKSKDDVQQSVMTLLNGLDSKPVKVGQRRLTQQLAVAGIVGLLYANQGGYKYLLQAVTSVIDDSDGTFLLFLADQLNERKKDGSYGQINFAFPAVRCLDTADAGIQGETDLAAAASQRAPVLGPFFGPDLLCPVWPVAAVPKLKLTGAGAAPIVVIGTTNDPATPYENAVTMAEQLKSGVLVTFRGYGHTAYADSPCVQKLVVNYLVEGKVPSDQTTC